MLVRGTCLVALVGAGCSFQPGVSIDNMIQDGMIEDPDAPPSDARVDAPPNSICYGTGLFVECYQPGTAPMNVDVLSSTSIDTGMSSSCTKTIPQGANLPPICLRAYTAITINGYVRFRGANPVVLLATGAITISSNATLDVSSTQTDVGAGGDATLCVTAGNGNNDTSNGASAGAGGAGGGGFGSLGGVGGSGDASGGPAGGTTGLSAIRGGCRGGKGGTSSDGAGGDGGHGGGAVYMIAGSQINVAGTIKANGSGGSGGPNKAGGGGGGSGGLIAFDVPLLSISGTVYANGGGGGEGGGGGQSGESGSDPSRYDQRASGGNNNNNGGDGGGGSVGASTGGNGANAGNGGGGGGGGAGRIKVYQAVIPTGRLSPPAN